MNSVPQKTCSICEQLQPLNFFTAIQNYTDNRHLICDLCRFPNLIGQQIHRWTIVAYTGRKSSVRYWRCRCECGTERNVNNDNLIKKFTKSCGCHNREVTARRNRKNVPSNFTQNYKDFPEYNVWMGMHCRCNNPNRRSYKNYGSRGIKVCERWKSFANFYEDMGARPTPEHTLDRIDVNGNYEPSNCRWATQKVQSNNCRRNVYLTIDNQTLTMKEWADKTGIKYWTLVSRLKRGILPHIAIQNRSLNKTKKLSTEPILEFDTDI